MSGMLNCNRCNQLVKSIKAYLFFDDQQHYCSKCIDLVIEGDNMREAHKIYEKAKDEEYLRNKAQQIIDANSPSDIQEEGSTKGEGLRYNSNKPEIHQVPSSLILGVAEVLKYGEQKYAKGNWKKGMEWSIPYDCLMRHMFSWLAGNETDDESGLSHLYHAAANIAMLIEYKETHKELDDREF